MKANLAYWRSVLRQAEAALDAAATRSAVNAAASQLMLAKVELKRLHGAAGSESRNLSSRARACHHPWRTRTMELHKLGPRMPAPACGCFAAWACR
jgi:hypothetical protein